jgi:hypothetical protein
LRLLQTRPLQLLQRPRHLPSIRHLHFAFESRETEEKTPACSKKVDLEQHSKKQFAPIFIFFSWKPVLNATMSMESSSAFHEDAYAAPEMTTREGFNQLSSILGKSLAATVQDMREQMLDMQTTMRDQARRLDDQQFQLDAARRRASDAENALAQLRNYIQDLQQQQHTKAAAEVATPGQLDPLAVAIEKNDAACTILFAWCQALQNKLGLSESQRIRTDVFLSALYGTNGFSPSVQPITFSANCMAHVMEHAPPYVKRQNVENMQSLLTPAIRAAEPLFPTHDLVAMVNAIGHPRTASQWQSPPPPPETHVGDSSSHNNKKKRKTYTRKPKAAVAPSSFSASLPASPPAHSPHQPPPILSRPASPSSFLDFATCSSTSDCETTPHGSEP